MLESFKNKLLTMNFQKCEDAIDASFVSDVYNISLEGSKYAWIDVVVYDYGIVVSLVIEDNEYYDYIFKPNDNYKAINTILQMQIRLATISAAIKEADKVLEGLQWVNRTYQLI